MSETDTVSRIPELAAVSPARAETFRPVLLALNGAAILVGALYFGRELMVPLVLATLLAFVLAPACALLERARLPRVLAVLVTVVLTFVVVGGIGLVVGRQVAQLASSLPSYQATVTAKWAALSTGDGLLPRMVGDLPEMLGIGPRPGANLAAAPVASDTFGLDTPSTLALARTVAQPLLGPAATAGVVLVFTLFILLSSEDLRDRVVRLMGRRDLHRTILAMNDAARRLSRFFLFQLGLNTGFGVLIGSCLWLAGLPNPVLWGILAALMRFVPFIGIVIAVVPPLLLAVAVVPGWSLALIVLGLFVGSELLMGQVIEPLIYGHSTGLSPIAVIVATAFWAFLWGPVGLLLATPLTVCLVVLGRHVERLAFLDVILGDQSPLEPAETFYQRALEGNAAQLAVNARQSIAKSSLAEYYDTVALRGLGLAQEDTSRDALAFERLEAIHDEIEKLLDQVAMSDVVAREGPSPPAPDWQADRAVLCIPGRGQLDDLAAIMAVQVLGRAGFGAALAPNATLGSANRPSTTLSGVRLCCLSVLEQGSNVSGIRYFIRRIAKIMPQARVVVCLWHADRNSPLLAALRSEGQEEQLVLSIGELLALAQVLSARGSGG